MSATPLDLVEEQMQEASYDSYDSIVASSAASMSQSFDKRPPSTTSAVGSRPSSWQPQSLLEDSMLSVNTAMTGGNLLSINEQ